METEALSETEVTLRVEDHTEDEQTGVSVTPPTLMFTLRPFSEQVPLTV